MKKVTIHPMTEAEVEWLEQRLMDYGNDDSMLSLSALDGFLTAVLSGPELVPPSQWWPVLWGGTPPEWSSERDMKRALDLILGHMNILAHTLCYQPEHFIPVLMANYVEGQEICNAEEWCFGYLRGMALGNWPALPEEQESSLEVIRLHGSDDLLPQLASLSLPEHQQSVAEVGTAALRLHAHFLAQRGPSTAPIAAPALTPVTLPVRTAPKIGRNDPCPCPCGSGKKFKQCCLH
ncbi:hypothetical protein CJP16_00205 [Aeromonas sobria]|uniref:YecA family protein n=1 Tax=Aeromonas sobria TaxID=646 RepID=A0A2N3J9R1_AERSO|nr:UPF0149 family protein [Aeromonas sobria]PKQ83322.1 hypothetical protein CJP16_00205 [Aeromonas sobria]